MSEIPKSNGQSPKSPRRFAVEIIARLVGAVARVVSGVWEHRTSNAELRTSKEDNAAGFSKLGERNLVHPLLPEGGEGRGEEANKNVDEPVGHDFEVSGAHIKPLSTWERIGVGAAVEHSTTNIQRSTSNEERAAHHLRTANTSLATPATGERDARSPRQAAPTDPLSHPAFPAPRSTLPSDFVSHQELKRELDSLRRLIESRK
jgi:hypothetical protein